MSDLKARIGPKVGQYPHKTWLRPGFVPVSSPKKIGFWQQQKHRDPSGFGSDSSSHDDDLLENPQTISPPSSPPSLLARLGISDQPMDDTPKVIEPEHSPKSLIERVGGVKEQHEHSVPSPTLKSAWPPTSGDRMSPDSHKENRSIATTQLPKPAVKSEPIEGHLNNVLDSNNQAISDSESVTKEQNEPLLCQSNGATNNQETDTPYPQNSNGFVDGPLTPSGENGVAKNLSNSPNSHPTSHLGDSSPHTNHNNLLDNNSSVEKVISQQSAPEDGEVRGSLSEDQVRVVLLPLMLRNAEGRKKETESEATSSQPTLLNPNVLTNEACSTVAGTMTTVRREMITYSRSVWPSPEPQETVHDDPLIASPMAGPSKLRSEGRPADMDAYSPPFDSPLNDPSIPRHWDAPTPSTSSGHFEPAHLYNFYGPPLRYTPSPERPGFQPLHTRKQSTSQTVPSAHDTIHKKRRSRSPVHSRKRSLSRGRLDNRRSIYEREVQPLPKSDNGWPDRRPVEERETHASPKSDYSWRDRRPVEGRETHALPKSDNGWRDRHIERREIHPPEPEFGYTREPRHRSGSLTATRLEFFPDRRMQLSPEHISRSPDGYRDDGGSFSSNRVAPIHPAAHDIGHSRRSSYASYGQKRRARSPSIGDLHDKESNGRLASPPRRPSYGSYGPRGRARTTSERESLHDNEGGRRSVSPARRSSYSFKGRSDVPARWDDLEGARRSASPPRRGQYKPYTADRRRSRSPPRRRSRVDSRRQPHRLPGRRSRSPDRRPRSRERISTPDDSHSRSSMSVSLNTDSPSESHHPRQKSMQYERHTEQQIPSAVHRENKERGPRPIESQNEVLPCHRVPGLWFVKLGLDALDTLNCIFDIDHDTAKKWNIPSINGELEDTTDYGSLQTHKRLISLQLCAFSKQRVEDVIQRQSSEMTPEDLAKAIFALEPSWPTQGHLIIIVNPESKRTRTWLPQDFGPTCPPHIENHIHEGQNVVQFIQLSGMSEVMFGVFATEKIQDNIRLDSHDPGVFLRSAEEGEAIDTIGIKPGTVTVSPIDSSN